MDVALPLIMRWIHIGSAITVVGGTVFTLFVLLPAARELGGLAYDESQVVGGAAHRPARRGGTFNWHAWAEIHDGRRWVSIDPTWNEVQVDATHLVLSVGPEDFAWVNILGKMKLRVIEFRKQA